MPVHDDRRLFEMLILEGAQAGLSWSTILRKRAGYRRAFAGFDPSKVARFDARRRAALMRDPGIVRNRLKIDSTVTNARAFLAVQREFGSFDRYLWAFVDGEPLVTRRRGARLPARTALSDRISKDSSSAASASSARQSFTPTCRRSAWSTIMPATASGAAGPESTPAPPGAAPSSLQLRAPLKIAVLSAPPGNGTYEKSPCLRSHGGALGRRDLR